MRFKNAHRSNDGATMDFPIVRIRFHEIATNGIDLMIVFGTQTNHSQKFVQHDHSMFQHGSFGILECFLCRKRNATDIWILKKIGAFIFVQKKNQPAKPN